MVFYIVIYDVTDHKSYENATTKWLNLSRDGEAPNTVFMLVGNRCHLSHLQTVPTEEAKDFAEKHSVMFIETSFEDMSSLDTALLDLVAGQLCDGVDSHNVSR